MPKAISNRVYPETEFGGYSRVDGTVEFYSRVQALMPNQCRTLDIGCGRGKHAGDDCNFRRELSDLRRSGRFVLGIDVDAAGTSNPMIDEFRLMNDVNHWPVEDASIDVAVANSVLEHVSDPSAFFSEAWRVLKPGGHLCIRTYNRWGYVGICARLTPNRLHSKVTSYVQDDRKEQDVFPTVYRCNSPRAVARALRASGFSFVVYTMEAEPSYLSFSPLLYRVGAIMHRWIPSPLRWSILAFARKPEAP